ncbi:transcriptional regulator [Marinitenerispora sediminis]|uniref:Transcriptional regulator n=2 Tax=Marinitenerispora sediminis TaxID=1931232 RepID=A0A368T2T9_9ACTN|nr:transcriptional regulator [Marinitenerispora sediminis]RCV56270.1 transcriptional regulator [Marinitenerispora sediminis]RCV61202.1 transcriptional regulator [Marinitenerispora sediminis]
MVKKSDGVALKFGRTLRETRRLAGKTQERLAREVGVSSSHLSNVESGYRFPPSYLVASLDKALETGGRLLRLWEQLTDRGRPAWLTALADLEREATTILDCQTTLFPGLLQTEEYARVVLKAAAPWASADFLASSVEARLGRGQRFVESESPILWTVLDEMIVKRCVGSPEIMRNQLSWVVDLVERGRVTVQIIPVSTTHHPGLAGPFRVISAPANPDVVYAESIHSGQIIDEPTDVARYRLVYGALQAAALSPPQSLSLLRKELEGLQDEP